MIIITNIDYIETPNDIHTIMHDRGERGRSYCAAVFGASVYRNGINVANRVSRRVLTEHVKGRVYTSNIKGVRRDVVIGLPKNIQDLLGIQYDAQDELIKSRDELFKSRDDYRSRLNLILSANWKTRLKWLFKGIS